MPPTVATLPASRSQFVATVSANVLLCREHYLLGLRVEDGFPPTRAGQFVQLVCRDPEFIDSRDATDWDLDWFSAGRPPSGFPHDADLMRPTALLRRPFSLAGRRDLPDGGTELEIIHRVVGVGTEWLAERRAGDRVGVLGPLGNRFALPPAGGAAILVGGGVGIPPMLYLAEALAQAGLQDRSIAFCGATSRELLPLTITDPQHAAEPARNIAEFARHGIRSVVSTDDGTYGFGGFVTQALGAYLERADPTVPGPILYTCGPEPMMKRVAAIGASRSLQVQVAVERAMACGMGTCQSCCIRLRSESDWSYKLACTDGPIFRGEDLLW